MTEPLAPYTGLAPAIRHHRGLLIGVAAFAVLSAILTVIGGVMFAGGPIEEIYRFGLVVDLIAMALVIGIFILVETVQRQSTRRIDAPVNPRFSIFAIVAIMLSAVAVSTWATTGGPEQLGYLLTGIRGRYMYHTGGLFIAGIPWTLGVVFGAWGFRPGASLVTNVAAIVAIAGGLFLAVVTTVASVVYGLGYSD